MKYSLNEFSVLFQQMSRNRKSQTHGDNRRSGKKTSLSKDDSFVVYVSEIYLVVCDYISILFIHSDKYVLASCGMAA